MAPSKSLEKKDSRRTTTWKKIHPVFNEALLTPHKPPAYPQQQQPRPALPIIVEGDEEYEVDEILDS